MHRCLNVVCGPAGAASAVLIRAVEPLEGADLMRRARLAWTLATSRRDQASPEAARRRVVANAEQRLAAGPALVAAAFSVDLAEDGTDLLGDGQLRLEPAPVDDLPEEIAATPRVGVARAGEPWASLPWRFVLAASPSLSRPLAEKD